MKELQHTLLTKLRSVYDNVKSVDDKETRKQLLKNILQEMPEQATGSRATNIRELLTYFMELNHYDIDGMVQYLDAEVTNGFDIVTMQREKEDDFDGMYGTCTSIIMSQFEMPEEITPDRLFFSARFHPSPVRTVQFALDTLARAGKRYGDFVFIDIGTGTGRNLLLASKYSFKEIIGVEISSFLCRLAEDNIKKYNAVSGRQTPITVQCADALQFQFPKENMVLYFWEPFQEKVGDPFILKLMEFSNEHNLHLVLIFLQTCYQRVKNEEFFNCAGVFEAPDVMDERGKHFTITIYERKPLVEDFILEF
jgi:SAM-dependent methyltransferase